MKTIVQIVLALALSLAAVMTIDGCAANGDNTAQIQKFQDDYAFWSAEVNRLKVAADALPPGKTRDDLSKNLATAQYFVAFFGALIPPTTQPVK